MSMKKSIKSVKGGASTHTRPCKITYCDKHNLRLDETPSNKNIRPELSVRNSSWVDPSVPNLVALDKKIRKDYFMYHGRHLPSRGPSKASPIKESVTRMPNGEITTDEIHERITNRIEKEFGIRCIRRYNHRDEFCEETGTFNFHGHEVWDFYDYEQHRIVPLDRAQMRRWQKRPECLVVIVPTRLIGSGSPLTNTSSGNSLKPSRKRTGKSKLRKKSGIMLGCG